MTNDELLHLLLLALRNDDRQPIYDYLDTLAIDDDDTIPAHAKYIADCIRAILASDDFDTDNLADLANALRLLDQCILDLSR